MAPSAIEVQTDAALDAINKPPPDTVIPPKDIRSILEKTAGYVSRNGAVFEDRIRQKEINNPKFSFLSANDAYNAYYLWRLEEINQGRGNMVSAGRVGEEGVAIEQQKPKGPEAPPDFHFSARMPIISAQDLEVVRLTALFVAKNGRSFMTALSQRESTNYQFDFLRPQHSLYQFFSRLIDQYSEILNARGSDGAKAEKIRVAELQRNINDRFNVLRRARQRAEWVKYQEQQKQAEEEEAEAEKLSYAQIDWHDFVVVETVLFTEADDETDLPPPTSLSELQSASLEQKGAMSLQPHNMRIEEAMPSEDDTYMENYPQHQQFQPQQQTLTTTLPPPPAHLPAPPVQNHPQIIPESEEDRVIRERTAARDAAATAQAAAREAGTAPMRIRSDYVPRAQQQRRSAAMSICPNCKQQIPNDELEQHMKIELLDPRWREQRAKADSRYATTNLSTSDVANNLKRLASQRTDVFDGVTGEKVSEEEASRRKRAALAYDGVPLVSTDRDLGGGHGRDNIGSNSLRQHQMQNVNIEDQLRHIRQKAAQGDGSS